VGENESKSGAPPVVTSIPKERPLGVAILAVLFFLTGAIDGLGILYTVLKMFSMDPAGVIVYIGLAIYLLAMAAVLLAKAALFVAAGLGLMKLQNWARLLSIGLIGFGLVIFAPALLLTFVHRPLGSLGLLVAFAIAIWTIVYLLKPHVKRAFGATGL
jgi:hypothetical protein